MSGKEHHRASHTPTLTVTAFKLWRLARRIGAGGHNPQKSRRRNALWRPLPAATASTLVAPSGTSIETASSGPECFGLTR